MKRNTFSIILITMLITLLMSGCVQTKPQPTMEPTATTEPTPTAPPVSIDGIVLDSDYIISILDKADKISCSYKADYSSDGVDRKIQFWQLDGNKKIAVSVDDTQITTVSNEDGIVYYDSKTKELKKTDVFVNPAYEKLNPEMAKTTTFFYQSQKKINDKNCLEISWIDESGQKMYASISESDGIIMKVFTDSSEYVYNYSVTDFTTEGIEAVVLELPGEAIAG